jgi:hypothetical protein
LPYAPERFNPYEPPSTDLEELPPVPDKDVHAQETRRAYLGREEAVKRLSWLNVLLAIVWLPATLRTLGFSAFFVLKTIGFDVGGLQLPLGTPTGPALIVLTVFHVGCFILNVALVLGLRALQPWARWTELVVALVFLIFCLIYVGDVFVNFLSRFQGREPVQFYCFEDALGGLADQQVFGDPSPPFIVDASETGGRNLVATSSLRFVWRPSCTIDAPGRLLPRLPSGPFVRLAGRRGRGPDCFSLHRLFSGGAIGCTRTMIIVEDGARSTIVSNVRDRRARAVMMRKSVVA